MEIQLTKTKTITIGGGPKKKRRKSLDVVGIDLFGGDSRGFPAVRIVYKKGHIKVLTAGFVPAPEGELPTTWEDAAKHPIWQLPTAFQAPHAAFSVSSPELFLSQTTMESVKNDILNGAHQSSESATEAKPRKFGIRREPKKVEKSAAENPSPVAKIDVSTIVPGVPVSNGGTRFVMREMSGGDGFVMEAGMPEYQILWLSRLLPEGRRPTVASVQPHLAAYTASILHDPEFLKAEGTGIAVFLDERDIVITGFKNRDLVMWRKCRGLTGTLAIREQLIKGLGVSEDMLEGVLNDNLIDPRPVLEGILMPLVDEFMVSRDYLAGKLGTELKTAFLVGLDSGFDCWNSIFSDHAHLKFTECPAFAGIEGRVPEAKEAKSFTGALGAALALMAEDDE